MLRSIWIISASAVMTFFCSIAAMITGLFNPYSNASNRVLRFWANTLLKISGIELEIIGQDKIESSRSYVFMSNHQGTFDIMASMASIPGTARFIAKKELFRIPVFAQGMRLAGIIEIDRGNSQRAKRSIEKAVGVVQDGVSVIIYPEGTRSRDGSIQPFKKGGFVLALDAQVPIAPMVISGSLEIMKKKSLKLHRGKIYIQFLDPIPTQGLTYQNRDHLIKTVRSQIIQHFLQH